MLLRFAGHSYREAADTEKPSAKTPEQQVDERFGEGTYAALSAASKELLNSAKVLVEGDPIPAEEIEADGIDLIYQLKIPGLANSAKLTLDYAAVDSKAVPQEAILELCNVGYAAIKPKPLLELLKAIATLQRLSPPAAFPKTSKDQVKARDWAEYYLPGVLVEMQKALVIQQGEAGGDAQVKFEDRNSFRQTLDQLQKNEATAKAFSSPENAAKAINAAKVLDDYQWKSLVATILATRGKAFPTRELVNKKVAELTAHERYSGQVDILGYEKDQVVVGVRIPPPMEGLLFGFRRPPGTNDVQLVEAGLVLCGKQVLVAKKDEELTKLLITAMVDLTLASDVAANPEYSQPPGVEDEDTPQLSIQELNKELRKGLALWYSDTGYIRLVLRGGENSKVCLSEEDLKKELVADESTLKNWLREVQLKQGRVFRIDIDGAVHLMNYEFQIIQRNISNISDPGKFQCSGPGK